jgi:hypothetical protein
MLLVHYKKTLTEMAKPKKMKCKNPNDEVIMCMASTFDATAYNEGQQAYLKGEKFDNPYKENTNKYFNYNKGWNTTL